MVMTWPIQMQLPYPISNNRYLGRRVVPRKGGRGHIAIEYLTAEAKEFKAECQRIAAHCGITPIVGPIEYELELYPKLPQDWRTRAKRDPAWWDMTVQCLDLDNCRKVLLDALNGIAWTDDSWICHDPGWRMPPVDRAMCILRVKPYERPPAHAEMLRGTTIPMDLGIDYASRQELQPKPPAPVNEPLSARPF